MQTPDSWQSYGDNGGHGHPKVPESSTYGFLMLGLLIMLVLVRKLRNE